LVRDKKIYVVQSGVLQTSYSIFALTLHDASAAGALLGARRALAFPTNLLIIAQVLLREPSRVLFI